MTEDTPAAADPPRRWRVWIRRTALSMVALLCLVVIAVFLALTTSLGTGILLRQGAAIYSGMIPGSIEFEASEGALSDATTLRNLSVRDATGVRLVEADRLKLGVDLPKALGRTIDVGTIEIEGVVVDVGGNFADLGPPGPSEPTPPSPTVGPDLPVELRGTLEVRSVLVRDGPRSIVRVHKLDALVWGAGTAATLQLQTSAAIPTADVSVDALTLAANWDSPTLRVPSLLAETSEGSLFLSDAYVDFEAEHFELGAVQARASTKYLAAVLPGEPTGSATLLLEGGGPFDDMLVEAFVRAPHVGNAVLVAEGGIGDVPWASVLLELGLEEAQTESGMRLPSLAISLEAEAEGDLGVGIDARVHARCVGCDRDLDPIELNATGRASPGSKLIRLDADVSAEALTVHAGVRGSALLGGGAALSLRIPALAELSPLINRFAPGLGLKGAVTVDATCGALLDPTVAVCRTTGGVKRGAPVQRAGFDLSVGVGGDHVAALVHNLRIDQGQARIRVGPEPARVLYTPELVTVHDVRARFGTTEGLGTLVLDGELGLTDAQRIEASARVSGLPLRSLGAIIPSLDVGGVLSSSVDVGGTLSAPTLKTDVRGRGLRYESVSIGELGLNASYAAAKLEAKLDVVGGDLGTIDLDARVPVLIDAHNGKYEFIGRRRSSISLNIADASLGAAHLAGPKLSSLRGRLDLTLQQTGSLARPDIDIEAALREGAFQSHTLPEVGVRLQYAGQTAEATMFATHPDAFDRIEFSASAPVALDILRGAAKLRTGDSVTADLVLTNIDLAYARRLDERVTAKGLISMNAKLRGDPAAPQLALTLDANALSWQEQAVGDISLGLGYEEEMAVARLWAAGPEVSGIGLDASVPITLDLAATSAQWHTERPHDVQVAVNELRVRPTLARIPGVPALDLDARADAVFELHGSAARPTLSLHAEVDDIVYGGREAGDAVLDARYGQARAHAEVSWNAPRGRTAWVSADAPLALDLPNRTAQWDQSGEHHVRVSIPKLDRSLLEPFVDAGDFEGAVAVHAIVDGSLQAFDGSLSARGFVGRPGHKLPVDARFVIAPTQQTLSVDLGPSVHVRAATKAIVAELMEGADWKTTEIEATADIDSLRTSDFSPFLPNEIQNLRGRLNAHVAVGGRLGEPELQGSLALKDGAVTVVPARVRLTDLQVSSSFSNQGLALESLSFKAGDGSVSASGAIDVAPNEGLRASVDMMVKKFPLRAPGLPRMALSTQVRAKAFANLEAFDVNVGVGKTKIDVYATSISAAEAIPSNSNVVLADLSRPEAGSLETSGKADATPIPKHIKVDFGDDINIIGPSINMRWAGKLETRVDKDGAATSGKLNAKKGTFSLLGNEFDLEKGDVYLSDDGSAMPFLDVTANTSVEDVVISVAIRGPASRPEFELSSVPALPQSEIFTILVTGTSDTQGADSEEVQDKAAGILAAMSNSALQRQIGQKLRVDKIGVGFGDSTDQPILSVGKNVTKKVYAETEYHHNAPAGENTAQLEVEYEFAPRWSLQTFFGDAAEGGIAVFWGFAFDTEPRPKKAAKSDDPVE